MDNRYPKTNAQIEKMAYDGMTYLSQNPKPQSSHSNHGQDVKSLPTGEYLESTVGPILFEGLRLLSLERPQDPLGFLGTFLLNSKHRNLGTTRRD